MPSLTSRFHHRLFRNFSKKYDLKYRAAQEAILWDAAGHNYRELWRHHTLYITETQSIYICISKSANSAIRRALTDTSFSNAFDRERNRQHGILQLPDIFKTLEDVIHDQTACFTVVRNPVNRFWSAYQNKILEHPEEPLAAEVLHFHQQPDSTTISPEMLLDYIEQTPSHLTEEHVRPQWACCGHGKIPFKLVAKVESLDTDMKHAVEQGLFPRTAYMRLPHSNHSQLAVEDSTKRTLRSRIEQCYAQDFEAFGY